MSKRDPEIALRQILSHAREAVELCKGRTRSDLDSDRLLNLALTRLVEITGEAANRVPNAVQEKYPDLPWMPVFSLVPLVQLALRHMHLTAFAQCR